MYKHANQSNSDDDDEEEEEERRGTPIPQQLPREPAHASARAEQLPRSPQSLQPTLVLDLDGEHNLSLTYFPPLCPPRGRALALDLPPQLAPTCCETK
eukprot:767019-Pelagomonas_calceolata.AAC.2